MTKSDLITALAGETDLPQHKAEEIVDAIFDIFSKSLGECKRIEIRGFGSFEVREYSKYVGRNPRTGKTIAVAGKRLPFFRAGKELRSGVAQNRT
jgi:integration host factor subunit beta